MNVKLDDYEVRVLINGLIQQHRAMTQKPTVRLTHSPFACVTLLKQ